MKDIVEYIVKQFASKPEGVEVTEESQDGMIRVILKVDPLDMGLTIGKSGQTIKAIRRLLTVKAISDNVRVNLELIDSNPLPQEEKIVEA
ncbi:MAG TPA: KH domain-containing protein [Patescibacteria group bacterium]|nr:KH domain-containing protein [Patescibacteria group bacterium]